LVGSPESGIASDADVDNFVAVGCADGSRQLTK
jgi:hypothetical protein